MAEAAGYLAIGRPDLFTESSVFGKPKGTIPKLTNVLDTFVIIILSALIFITIFSYADVIRSYIDSKYINKVIKSQVKSRIYFSIISTLITIFVCLITFFLYKIFGRI